VSGLPRSLGEWRDHFATRGPGPTAEAWLLRLAEIPPDRQSQGLCGLPDIPTLRRRFEAAWSRREAPLTGTPFLAKDLFHLAGEPTLAGSPALAEVLAAPEGDSEWIRRLRDGAGAVCCGKTQLNELAFGLSGENPHFGDCRHPARHDLLSGGSSSGSAWAVGAGLVPLALATDTVGSIRVPASWCGVHGVRLPAGMGTGDIFPLSPGFDTLGWMTRDARDLRQATLALLGEPSRPLGRGLWLGDPGAGVPTDILRLQQGAALDLGAEEDPASADALRAGLRGAGDSYPILGGAAAARVHAPWMETLRRRGDPKVVERLAAGAGRTAAELASAEDVRRQVAEAFHAAFAAGWDWIALPCTAGAAVPVGGHDETVRRQLLALNAPASLAGLACLSRPVAIPEGLTAGIQLVVPDEDRLRAAVQRGAEA
jgi:Asp-tRNA(Asn)/Glu-tRNA(Gln) amidotransferase A subunit family amidase